MTDLSTTYLGLSLRTPIVASAGPLTGHLDTLRALAAAGAAAVVLPSLFEEQIIAESLAMVDTLETGSALSPEFVQGHFPDLDDYNTGPIRYLRLVGDAKKALDIPVVASLNGTSRGGWVEYARMLEDAGADALELNVYRIAADLDVTAHQIEEETADLVASIRSIVGVPLAVKLGPYYTAFGHLARELAVAGADGLVLFNRFYQPDIDLETLDVAPRLALSAPDEMRLPLRWIAMLHGRVRVSLALTTGVHDGRDAAKAILAGADVVMMTSALLENGPDHVRRVEHGLWAWMLEHDIASVEQMKGHMSQRNVADPSAFARANYMQTITSATRDYLAG